MILYATDADLGAWSANLPADTAPYLRAASALVADATRNDVYDVDPAGKPTDPWHIDAMRDATCMQVAYWLVHGIDPTAGVAGIEARVAKSSIAGATYETDIAAQEAELKASVDTLRPSALDELRRHGLASARVRSW